MVKTILLLDDDREFRQLVVPALESHGHAVLQAARAADAATILASRRPDLVIVDGLLPDVDGITWLTRLRASGDDVPVVFVSAFWRDLASFNRLTRELKVGLVIHKPVLPAVFAEAIDAQLAGPRPKPPSAQPAEVLRQLQIEYARELPGKIRELAHAIHQLRAAPGPTLATEASTRAHRLHGTAGSYGFREVSETAGRLEEALARAMRPVPGAHDWSAVEKALIACTREADVAARSAEDGSAPRCVISGSVLVVGDDPQLRALVREVGSEQLLDVTEHASASELPADAESPDAAVIALPPEQAFELARELRLRRGFGAVPIAIVGPGGAPRDRIAAAHAGASIYLEAPVSRAAADDAVRRLVAVSQARQPRVLVVDDDEQFARRAVAVLRRSGVIAQSLAEPGAILDALEESPPDLVLLDAVLPGLSGYDVCRMLRATPRWQELPILMASAQVGTDARLAAFEAGADDYVAKPVLDEELLARVRVRVDRARLLREKYDKDSLTGLLLRRPFVEGIRARLLEAARHSRQLAVCIIDLDRFKDLNDHYGHLAGDGVLAAFGALLLRRFRAEDLRARWGGEEFALAFPGESVETIEGALQRLLEEFRGREFRGEQGEAFRVSFSAGVAAYPADGASLESLLKAADRRLYAAKRGGRNAVVGRD